MMREWLIAKLGGVPIEVLDEAERNLGALEAEADRERNRRAQAEDALILERAARPEGVELSLHERVMVVKAHLDAVSARADRLVRHG